MDVAFAEVSADYTKGKHQESSVLLRSQSRRLVVRQGWRRICVNQMPKFFEKLSSLNPKWNIAGAVLNGCPPKPDWNTVIRDRTCHESQTLNSFHPFRDAGGLELLLNAMQRFQRNLPLQRSAVMAVGQLSSELKTKDRLGTMSRLGAWWRHLSFVSH